MGRSSSAGFGSATREADVSNASRSPVSRAASFSTSSSPVIGQRWPISVLIEARPLGSGKGLNGEIGRAHVRTPVTNAHLVCRLLLEKQKNKERLTSLTYRD